MAEILWGSWQAQHIRRRHGVSAMDFDRAWHDPNRRDLGERRHHEHGPYYVSIGSARLGRPLTMVWRWQASAVWPITACFHVPRVADNGEHRGRGGGVDADSTLSEGSAK